MIRTPLCDMLGIKYPIIQGGMAHIAEGHLAAAVSEGGGFGVIGSGFADPEFVLEQIKLVRSLTDKPFGVNIILENPRAGEIAKVCAEERIVAVTTGAGSPAPFMPMLTEANVKVIPVIPHTRAAKKMAGLGATALVAEGMESGGHVGKMTTLPLVPQVVDAVDIPVIAAGGIGDGRGLVAALAMGAIGVQMGTFFLATEECCVSDVYKKYILDATDNSTLLTGLPGSKQVRCIKNSFTDGAEALRKRGCSQEEMDAYCTGSLRAARDGDSERGGFSAGQISGMIKEIKPAAKAMQDMMEEAEQVLAQLTKTYGNLR